MINYRAWIVLAILALMAIGIAQSHAAVGHHSPNRTTCKAVRDLVAMVGAAEAVNIARNAGATEAQIAEARRCLK